MRYRPVEREPGAYQQPVTPDQIQAICRRALAADAVAAVELGLGTYNSTYRVTVAGRADPVILRVAPAPDRQYRSEREMMRAEYTILPWLAGIAPLMPRVLAADWSHEVIGRDWMVQTLLPGVPAPDGLPRFPRSQWSAFYRQLGRIAATVHAVRGPYFGPVTGPGYTTWSEAVLASLADIVADLADAGLDAADLRLVAAEAAGRRAVLDEIAQPYLLVGDLWTVNVMLDPDAPQPTITGVLDLDRALWGDPRADWTIYLAQARSGPERDAFWSPDGYGPLARTSADDWRSRMYRARHLGAIRLESHRLGHPDRVRATYEELRE